MLKKRILSLLIFVPPLVCFIVFASNYVWFLVSGLIGILAFYEWNRACNLSYSKNVLALVAAFGFLLTVGVFGSVNDFCFTDCSGSALSWVLSFAVFFWVTIVPFWLYCDWKIKNRVVLSLMGFFVLVPLWLSIGYLHKSPTLLLFLIGAICTIDTSAYFVGKHFGRNKLALSISPGKTIEGFIGGFVGLIAYFYLVGSLFPSFQSFATFPQIIVIGILVHGLATIGDLFESFIKRRSGLKDSGDWIPGHGGLLDRLDSLMPTMPFFGMYFLYVIN